MKSIVALAILLPLISGCATVTSCPPLTPPPDAVLDRLESAQDGTIDTWVDDLARHYDKLDACRG